MKLIILNLIFLVLLFNANSQIIPIFTQTVVRSEKLGNNSLIADTLNLLWPFSNNSNTADYPFSSTFGPRLKASTNYAYDFHRGIDIPRPNRTNLYAVGSGTVFRSRFSDSNDFYVALKLQHPLAIRTLAGYRYFYPVYRHLNQSLVVENQIVQAGDLIALSGEAADSGFDHLHFDIAVGSSFETNNTHPLVYMKYNDTTTPNITSPNPIYFNRTTRKLNVTVKVAEGELDLMGLTVNGYVNNWAINISAIIDWPTLNHITLVKPNLDNRSQTLDNGVVVTFYPEKHNINNTEYVTHFEVDFTSLIGSLVQINNYELSVVAYDARDGYGKVVVTGV